jgi:hypothetical protein
MFLKELEAVLIPWWMLLTLITGDQGFWHWPILMMALYIVLTEIRYRIAVSESRKVGFKRMVRMPVMPWIIRIVLWRRMVIPRDINCYTVHTHGKPKSEREFIRELKDDITLGSREPAMYIGNTFYDLGEFARRQLGAEYVQVIDGAMFGRWMQTWKAPDERWRIVLINRAVKPLALAMGI